MSLPTKHHVVYADDDLDDLDLIRECFEKYAQNVELVTFNDGDSALHYLHSLTPADHMPCLIILDINLPGIDGKEVLKTIRTITLLKEIPIVLFTTSSQPHDMMFAKKYGAGFMTKPLSFQQMDAITEQFIEHCTDEIRKKIRKELL